MSTRVRRDPAEARQLILAAAEELLAAGGVAAVQVRAVAAKVGVTDAAVNHHFGGRDALLEALLRHGGRRLRARLSQIGGDDIKQLVHSFAAVYADGYGALALALHQSGWRDPGSGLLSPLIDALCARNRSADRRHIQLAVAALHQALALEPVVGAEFRRSVGLVDSTSADMMTWWEETLTRMLDR